MLISILQAGLKHQGLYASRVDGDYGAGTVTAVRAYQQREGITSDGECRESDWIGITGIPAPSVFDRSLHLTAAFEGHGFDLVVGNFDNAYLTWGIIGYTLKHDLPRFIQNVDSRFPGKVAQAFGSYEQEFRNILVASNSAKERWANSISQGSNRYPVRPDWREKFANLGSFPEVQSLQIEDSKERYWAIAVRDAKRWGAEDALDMALFFDTAVQNGGGGRASIAGPMDDFTRDEPSVKGEARRLRWARIIADGSNAFAINDVYSRRSTIAKGEGRVHGDHFKLADWGLNPTPVNVDHMDSVHVTFMPATFAPTPPPVTQPTPGTVTPPVAGTSAPIDLQARFKECVASAVVHISRSGVSSAGWGAPLIIPVPNILAPHAMDLPDNWQGWELERQSIALVQMVAKANSSDPGPIDGLWGQRTDTAFEDLTFFRDHGEMPPNWREDAPDIIEANPRGWPLQNTSSLTNYYGPPCDFSRRSVRVPWTLRLSWDNSTTVSSISCHEKVADSLGEILEAIHAHYGEDELIRLGLDQYGGCYNCRKKRGGSSWSTHAWAIAIDWDPDRNSLRWGRDRAQMARPEYIDWWKIWEAEGWVSLGRASNFDFMHVQAAKLR